MKDGKITIWITMDADFYPDIVIAILVLRNLKCQSIESDTVVVTYGTLIVFTENVFNCSSCP